MQLHSQYCLTEVVSEVLEDVPNLKTPRSVRNVSNEDKHVLCRVFASKVVS